MKAVTVEESFKTDSIAVLLPMACATERFTLSLSGLYATKESTLVLKSFLFAEGSIIMLAFANIENANAEFGDEATWKNSANQKRMTETQIRKILTGENKLTRIGEYQVIAKEGGSTGYTYVIYIPETMELDNLDVMKESAFLDAAFDYADGTEESMPYDYKTWFKVTNLQGGLLDLHYAETHSDSWAYGEANRRGGHVEGDFNNLWQLKN